MFIGTTLVAVPEYCRRQFTPVVMGVDGPRSAGFRWFSFHFFMCTALDYCRRQFNAVVMGVDGTRSVGSR